MGIKHILLLLFLQFFYSFSQAHAEVLKTMNVSMPTNFGTFFGEIHYSEKDQVMALRIERIIKEDLIKAINYFEYVPHDVVHFNLDPYLRLTNGNAIGFPTNIINLYNFPASNLDHLIVMENWLQGLVFHEYIHITHLDQTRGYLKVGREIFGTIAKIPAGIVPRWFTEGIAVWGESHLINGGRLSNELFNKELLIQFKKHDFCKTIDCLDEPGIYPGGELAYWAGAHFIEYIEKLKPKSIKCLIEFNSSSLPFFLNNAFLECTGEKAQDLYTKFREEYEKNESPLYIEKTEWGEKISNAFGSDDFQKGLVLDGDRLFKVERFKKSEALVAYDLKDEVNFKAQFDAPIADVSAMVDHDPENKMLLISFNDDKSFRLHNKVWKLVNPDTLLVERTLKFPNDPSYVVAIDNGQYVTFSYWNNQWQAQIDNEIIRVFPNNYNISMVKKLGDQLLLKINDSYGVSSLVLSDFKLKNLTVVYKSANYYELPLLTNKFFIIRENGNLQLIELGKEIKLSTLPTKILSKITFAAFNDVRVIALDNRLKTQQKNAVDSEKYILDNKSLTKPVETSTLELQPTPLSSYASDHAESYPRWDHFIPHYWFLAFGNSENLGSIGAMTTFSDPMYVDTLNATALIYPSVSKAGGHLEFVHKMVKISDLWMITALADQEYSKTDFNSSLNLSREFDLSTSYKFLYKRWTYIPSIFAGTSSSKDFVSDINKQNVGTGQALYFHALTYDDFFQYFTGTFNLQLNSPDIGANYFSTQLTADGGWRLTQNLLGSIKSSFSKLYKNDFRRGVVYGGGITDLTKIRIHEFYGLPYRNAYGNEIFTLRFMVDYNFWDIYRGKNLLPFFFKEAHILLGRESFYANRIFLDGEILKDKMINALFIGPRLKMNLFYYIPTNIDLIFSTIAHPNGKDIKHATFTMSASF